MELNSSDTVNVFIHEAPRAESFNPYFYWQIGLGILLLLVAAVYRKKLLNLIKKVPVKDYKISLGIFEINGSVEYNSIDQEAAWKMYVELITRVSGNRLPDGSGILRESLNSLYSTFGVLRNILKDSGAALARSPQDNKQETVATLLLKIMNTRLRPFLSEWHPKLEAHEKLKAENVSVFEHEKSWSQNSEFRKQLNALQDGLEQYILALKAIAAGKSN